MYHYLPYILGEWPGLEDTSTSKAIHKDTCTIRLQIFAENVGSKSGLLFIFKTIG